MYWYNESCTVHYVANATLENQRSLLLILSIFPKFV